MIKKWLHCNVQRMWILRESGYEQSKQLIFFSETISFSLYDKTAFSGKILKIPSFLAIHNLVLADATCCVEGIPLPCVRSLIARATGIGHEFCSPSVLQLPNTGYQHIQNWFQMMCDTSASWFIFGLQIISFG